MKLKVIAIVCILVAIAVNAATYSLDPIDVKKSGAAQDRSAGGDTGLVKVRGRGTGTERASALKDAYRDAVERAVGLYVDAEQMVKNDEIVREKILTQSNAYIEKCDIIKETTENGNVKIAILAEVKRRDLVKRITETMPPQTYKFLDGDAASAHAYMVSEAKRNADADALAENFLRDFNPITQLMTAGFVSLKPKIVQQSSDSVSLAYLMKIEMDQRKYFEVAMPKLKSLLDQISLTTPKTIRLVDHACETKVADRHSNYNRYLEYCESYKAEYREKRDRRPWWGFGGNLGCYAGLHVLTVDLHGRNTGLQRYPGLMEFDCFWRRDMTRHYGAWWLSRGLDSRRERSDCPGEVMLVTEMNAAGFKATIYTVDAAVANRIVDWQCEMLKKTTEYNVVFKDSHGKEIGGVPWTFERTSDYGKSGNGNLLNTCFVNIYNNDAETTESEHGKKILWLVTPIVGGWADQYIEWRTFEFKSDDIAKIAAVSVELAE